MSENMLRTSFNKAMARMALGSLAGLRLRLVRASRLGLAAMVGAGTTLGSLGCATGSPPPEVVEARYDGPVISLEEAGGQWIAVVRPDSPGWRINLDRRAEGYGFEGVYLSIEEPNPAFSYPLVPVEQRVALNVDATRPVKVFARVVGFDGESASGEAYMPTPAVSSTR